MKTGAHLECFTQAVQLAHQEMLFKPTVVVLLLWVPLIQHGSKWRSQRLTQLLQME